ncbi:ABC transporter ATP-binding protein [Paraliobacillus zengyii]|uniref:ABC transporter ATP-binding protein n=1 Tax=Paraliobacillus zengyii TaxID=2213194 RepID=UPI000DD48630|nr:ABC transporter ATP-binding protein [Paraliobacillus zengyii]
MSREIHDKQPRKGLGMPLKKAKDFKGTLKRLIGYLAPHKLRLIVVFFAAIISTIFTILSPIFLGKATTTIFEGLMAKVNGVSGITIDFDYIGQLIFILVFLYLFSAAFSYVQQFIMVEVSQKIVYKLRKDTNEKVTRLPLKFLDSHSNGDILSRATNDIDNISNTLQQSVTQVITSIVTIIGIIIMMFTISPLMTIIVLLTLPLSIVLTTIIVKKSQGYFKGQQRTLGDLNGHVEEMYTGHPIIKAFKREEIAEQQFEEINEQHYQYGWKAQFVSGVIQPLMAFVNNIGYVLICVVGAVLVTRGTIRIGDIQAFIQYARQFSQPITQAANISNIIQSTIASAERVFEILDEEELPAEVSDAKVISSPKGDVTFEHVRFGYNNNEIIINDLNIDVKKGQTIAIVGPTGAGKTTLINLLMRFYDVNQGKITIDQVDITELKRESLRSMFGMVLQDTWLFNGTIKENIAYGNEKANEEDIIKAAKIANADHFIRTLPEGYDTRLNEEASNLSQGEKQLLTISRAILADPTIMILDEATSSVDTRTEGFIQTAMNELMKNRTSFVIAHRLSTIKKADCILVMNEGNVIEQGTHAELLRQEGFYAELYNSQFTTQKTLETAPDF